MIFPLLLKETQRNMKHENTSDTGNILELFRF